MRKIIFFNLMTLDGFFEGPRQDITWHNVDDEFMEFSHEQLNETDLLIFGRITYELMAGFWPKPEAFAEDPVTAEKMNSLPKIVFSTHLKEAGWNNTRLLKTDACNEIKRIRSEPGKPAYIFGSSDLASDLMKQRLVDEFRILINPYLLGAGKPLFHDLDSAIKLKLIGTRTFRNGNVLLRYEPAEASVSL